MIPRGYTIQVLDKGYVRYLNHAGTDQFIVEAARVSYGSNKLHEEESIEQIEERMAKDKKLLFYLYKNKHTSPFEMCKIYLNIKLPIFVMRQYVRHRMQNLNEFSARYKELPDEFYIPKVWRKQDTTNKQGSVETQEIDHEFWSVELAANCADAYNVYQDMLKAGIAREMARMVLPVNIYTEIYACWDLKNLLHFITLREDSHAQAEIQEYSTAIKQIAKRLFPWTFEAYERFKFPCIEHEWNSPVEPKQPEVPSKSQ